MFQYIISVLVSAVGVVLTAYLLPGISVKNFGNALITAFLISLANIIIKPIMVFFTFPITVLTLGLFLLVINALIVLLVSAIFPDFKVKNFGWAFVFSIVLTLINSVLHWLL